MIKGFKEFIAQGNALELAVAVIIGGAFKPIVDSITKVIMTILGQIIGQPNFDSVGQFKIFASADKFVQPGTIITAVVNFLLVAAAVYFAIVLPMNKLKERLAREKAEEEAKEVTDVELLTEIRDTGKLDEDALKAALTEFAHDFGTAADAPSVPVVEATPSGSGTQESQLSGSGEQ